MGIQIDTYSTNKIFSPSDYLNETKYIFKNALVCEPLNINIIIMKVITAYENWEQKQKKEKTAKSADIAREIYCPLISRG